MLLSFGADPNTIANDSLSPFSYKSEGKHTYCARLLLGAGASMKLAESYAICRDSSPYLAARFATDTVLLQLLLDSCTRDPAISAASARSATLTIAVHYNRHEVLRTPIQCPSIDGCVRVLMDA
ncbi:uncharacterized protein BCR38DRAFT_444345 [Pseudomassariella vexata]|uniref:Uncharacterized protein n=1 Tax=Pseudomassariella vexata TaxID=1141098 RepID=A0A1Y2DNJ8_9PEZI|nr:uncharacterized protein BCR38DRAFT_444345 [Pseudomassariella vexata]ORY60235.1 hypothetical protein BCR38DRAFT_444345 [Pseudomassariella vexata]